MIAIAISTYLRTIIFDGVTRKKMELYTIFVVTMPISIFTERGDIRFRTGLRNKIIEAIYGNVLQRRNTSMSI